MTRLTIGVPVYNEEARIAECLESILDSAGGLTGHRVQVVVSDNASTDGTAQVLARFASDPRVAVITQPRNIGAVANFAFLLDRCQDELFCWIGADDRITPPTVPALVAALDHEPALAMAFCETIISFTDAAGLGSEVRFRHDPFPHLHAHAYHLPSAPDRVLATMSLAQGFDYPVYGVYRTAQLKESMRLLRQARVPQAEAIISYTVAQGPIAFVPVGRICKRKKFERPEQRVARYKDLLCKDAPWTSEAAMIEDLHLVLADDHRRALILAGGGDRMARFREQVLWCYGPRVFARHVGGGLRARIAGLAGSILPGSVLAQRIAKISLSLLLYGGGGLVRCLRHLAWQRRRKQRVTGAPATP